MRAGTEMYCHSFDPLYVVYFLSSGSTFLGLHFSLVQSERLGDVQLLRDRSHVTGGTAVVRRIVSVSGEFRESVRQGVTEPLQKCD